MSEVAGLRVAVPVTETVIAREVVAAIGAHATASVPGVLRLEGGVGEMLTGLGRAARQRIAGITPAPVTGVSATVTGGLTRLQVAIAVSGGWPVVQVVAAVQRLVTAAVADGTGLVVGGVDVAVLDVGLNQQPGGGSASWGKDEESWRADREFAWAAQAPGDGTGRTGRARREGPAVPRPGTGLGTATGQAGGSRAEVAAAVLAAVRSVPGLRPASPVRAERAGWMPWDPAVLAVSLGQDRLEVQLAATRLPLPPLLGLAGAAVRAATAGTAWEPLPVRLVVRALDAAALCGPVPTTMGAAVGEAPRAPGNG
jgi:uncharacterized alkaline shock family protein YloU